MRKVDIIVCVYNALDYVKDCLKTLVETINTKQHKLIIIDDASNM